MKKLFNRLMFKMGYVPVKTTVINIDATELMKNFTQQMKDAFIKVAKEL